MLACHQSLRAKTIHQRISTKLQGVPTLSDTSIQATERRLVLPLRSVLPRLLLCKGAMKIDGVVWWIMVYWWQNHPSLKMHGSSFNNPIRQILITPYHPLNGPKCVCLNPLLNHVFLVTSRGCLISGERTTSPKSLLVGVLAWISQTAQSIRMDESFRAALGTLRSGPSAYFPKVRRRGRFQSEGNSVQTYGYIKTIGDQTLSHVLVDAFILFDRSTLDASKGSSKSPTRLPGIYNHKT